MMATADTIGDMRLSVAMTAPLDRALAAHLDKGMQEDLTFALWRPSAGHVRYTAILQRVLFPEEGERILQGNVAFTADYLQRVLGAVEPGTGIAFLHSHPGPGWQGMSPDDVIAEQRRLAAAVAARTGLPLVGLTWGNDGAWSARFWLSDAADRYQCYWAESVRVVGERLRITHHPTLAPAPACTDAQVATATVWGEANQADIARARVGIVGLGSVGSIVAEALARTGVSHFTLIDHDTVETRNLDRTLGAVPNDVAAKAPKVGISRRLVTATHTAAAFDVEAYKGSVLSHGGLAHALDCDVLFSCVDRAAPRAHLNALAYAHLIPVVDGGILANVRGGELVHVDWRIHTVGPERRCLVCLGALDIEQVQLDRAGLLDDPAYIRGLGDKFSPLLARQNVFAFSLSVAAHEVLQFATLITGNQRIGGRGPQSYHGYPGEMEARVIAPCDEDCPYCALTATATDLSANCTAPEGELLPPEREDERAAVKASKLRSIRAALIAAAQWVRSRVVGRGRQGA